ncbi:hypothetical protein LV779_28180 [Streptomyces thinghirensis]|nr:hypothetical protein [Streptomyces thinghirensis]
MEAKIGRVVAMASNPTYDPNAWVGGIDAADYKKLTGKDSNYPLLNRATQGQAAPGSIFKVISTSAAVEAGFDFPDGGYDCSSLTRRRPGLQELRVRQLRLDRPRPRPGTLPVTPSYYRLAHQEWKKDGGNNPKNPNDYFYKAAHEFGLGKKIGIDLPTRSPAASLTASGSRTTGRPTRTPGASPARRTAPTSRSSRMRAALGVTRCAGDAINYSIGQGDTLTTPIQMATIYAAISNGGTMYDPSIGKAIISPYGKEIRPIEPEAHGKLPISKTTLVQDGRRPRRRRHPRNCRLAVCTGRLAAGQDPDARQDRYGRGPRQADHLLVRHVHRRVLIVSDDLPGRHRLRRLRPRRPQHLRRLYGVSDDGEVDSKKGPSARRRRSP